jgi:hypothetical protein
MISTMMSFTTGFIAGELLRARFLRDLAGGIPPTTANLPVAAA